MYTETKSALAHIKFDRRGDKICNIMCFDIEVSSFFRKNGKVFAFDKTKPAKFYEDCEKLALCYIWQFGIDDNVFYGRTLEDFLDFLDELTDLTSGLKKLVFIHNAGYEFQFLRNVLDNMEVFARKKRRVIYFRWCDYEFRCSYMLTRLSLEKWAEEKKLPVQKQVGNLDYVKGRTPRTKLTRKEIDYAIYDILVMFYGLKEYVDRYGCVWDIPLTQTGCVRKELVKIMRDDYGTCKLNTSLIIDNIDFYSIMLKVLWGGITHANQFLAKEVLFDVKCKDLTSSYPANLVLEKYPVTKFERVRNYEKYKNNEKYAFIIHFKMKADINNKKDFVRSKLCNTYISKSKCESILDGQYDNGRLISCKEMEIWCTDIDFKIIERCYRYHELEIMDMYISIYGWLSPVFVKYVLTLFQNKTTMKDIEEFITLYAKSKEEINALFGMSITKDIADEIVYENEEWGKRKLNEAIFNEKVKKKKRNIAKNTVAFQTGVWCVAYGRRNLWYSVERIDEDTVYMDTDSNKYVGEHEDVFKEYNKMIREKQEISSKVYNIPIEMYRPTSPKGRVCSIGEYDTEEGYTEFRTEGAKKYAYRLADGTLHMTVAGVRKSAISQIDSLEKFKDGLVFDIDHANKLLLHYNDDMGDFVANKGKYDEFHSFYKYGICMQPTTYKLGSLPEYIRLVENNKIGDADIFK